MRNIVVPLNQTMMMTDCLTVTENIRTKGTIFYETEISVLMLMSVVINLKWTSVCIIFDKETGMFNL